MKNTVKKHNPHLKVGSKRNNIEKHLPNTKGQDISEFAKDTLSGKSSKRSDIVKRGKQRMSSSSYYDKNIKKRDKANFWSYLFNIVSALGAISGVYFLLNPTSVPMYVIFIFCVIVICGLEYFSRELSDEHWDAVHYDKKTITANFWGYLALFVISAILTCGGAWVTYMDFAEPDPKYVAINKRIEGKQSELDSKKARNTFLQTSPTSYQKNPKTGLKEMRYNQEKELKENNLLVNVMIQEISALESQLPSDPSILTPEHQTKVYLIGGVVILFFIAFAIMYQALMRYRSKFDYMVSIEENKELYLMYIHLRDNGGAKSEVENLYEKLTDESYLNNRGVNFP